MAKRTVTCYHFFSYHVASYSNTLLNRVRPLDKSLIMPIIKTTAAWLVMRTTITNVFQLAMRYVARQVVRTCRCPCYYQLPLITLLCLSEDDMHKQEYCSVFPLFSLFKVKNLVGLKYCNQITLYSPIAHLLLCSHVKVVCTSKYGDVQEKIHFLENTRFKTLEHLFKTY